MSGLRAKCLALLLLAGAPWSDAAVATADPMPRFEPAPCGFLGVPADWAAGQRVECGWLHVPESRGKPGSRTLKLWVAIARAEATDRREDPILYIHGGPGYATVDYFFPYFPKSKTWPACRGSKTARGKGYGPSGTYRHAINPPTSVSTDVATTTTCQSSPPIPFTRCGSADPTAIAPASVPRANARPRRNHVAISLNAGG